MLELKNVSAGYGKVEVLHNLSLSVKQGEVVCLLGANGAGKTTLIKTILGLVQATAGEITLGGTAVRGKRPNQIHALGAGVVPEGKRLFPRMTVMENLRMGAFLEKNEQVIRRRITGCMELFPRLQERQHQLAGTMSGGEQSMLAVSRALMSDPKLILFDEPSFGLAPVLVEEIFRIVRRISQRGTTVLLVEQNAFKSLKVSDRGYVLQKGEIVLAGNSEDLMKSPEVQKAYLLNG